jgi:hypothetical protein
MAYWSIYDVLDSWLGERFDEKSLARLTDLPLDQVESLFNYLVDNPPESPPANLISEKWVPFYSPSSRADVLLIPITERLELEGKSLTDDHRLKHLYLYAHGVCLPTGLFYALDTATEWRDIARDSYGYGFGDYVDPTYGELARRYYFAELASHRPLADAGVLYWSISGLEDGKPHRYRDPAPSPHSTNITVESLLTSDPRPEFANLDLSDMPDFFPDAFSPLARHGLVVQLLLAELGHSLPPLMGYGHLFFRHPAVMRLFRFMVQEDMFLQQIRLPSGVESAEQLVTSTILRLDLPALDSLSIRDIVAIRKSNDVFAEWRSHLRNALGQAQVWAGVNDVNAVETYLRENLLPEAATLAARLKKSSALDIARASARSFELGLLGAGAGYAAGDGELAPTLASAAAAGLANAVHDWTAARSKVVVEKAYLAHYSALGVEFKRP